MIILLKEMIKAVIFDLDGTLTRPFLDFKQIRTEIGLPLDRSSLLEEIQKMPPEEAQRALAILERHEEAAVVNAEENEGVSALLDYLEERGIACAVVTRNSARSTFKVIEKLNLRIERVITRDSGFALKPSPQALEALIKEWGVSPSQVLMVGDFRYDIQAGKAAGTWTCLVTNGREVKEDGGPHFKVAAPGEVIKVLEALARKEKKSRE